MGICLSDRRQENVVIVKRTSDRLMSLKLLTPGRTYNIISVYAPLQGCEREEKDQFWNQLGEVLAEIPNEEEMVVGGYLNVGKERGVFERWHGGKSVGRRNEEGERIVKMTRTHDLALTNTFFTHKEDRLITYRSGSNRTITDYITVRTEHLGKVGSCRVIPGEAVAAQHRLLVMDVTMPRLKKN